MKTSVIFAHTCQEAEWAATYLKKHPNKTVKILTPTIAGRLVLEKHGIVQDHYFQNEYLEKNFYGAPLKKLIKKAKKAVSLIRPYFSEVGISQTQLIDALIIVFETEFTNAFFVEHYLRKLQKQWNPSQYFVSSEEKMQLVGWEPHRFSLASLGARFFLKKDKVRVFSPQKPISIGLSSYLTNYIETIKQIPFFFRNKLYQQENVYKSQKRYDFLLFSGGINLYRQSNIISRLLLEYSGVVFSGAQSPKDTYRLHRASVPFMQLARLDSEKLRSEAEKTVVSVNEKIQTSFKHLYKKNRLSTHFSPQITAALTYLTSRIFHKYTKKTVKQILLARTAIERYDPALIITTHDPAPSAAPFVFEGRAGKKKTIVVLHGWNDITLGADYFSDHMIVMGSYMTKWFQKALKKKPSTLHVAGFAHLDELFHKREAFWQKKAPLPTLKNKQIVFGLLLTLYPPNTYPQSLFLTQLFKAAKNNQFSGSFLIRTHPGQDIKEIEDLASSYGIVLQYNAQMSLEKFVKACDVLLSWDTSAIYWPMVYGKPLFYTSPLWGDGITPVEEYGAAWIPKSARDVFSILKKLQSNPRVLQSIRRGQRAFLKDIIGFYDGKTSEKMYKVIEDMLDNLK